MLQPITASDMATLRSLAARGDKLANVMIRAFDTLRSADKELVIVRAATTANRTLSGLTNTVLDGVTPVADDLILVKAQTDSKDNGIYVAHAGAWTRLKDDQGVNLVRPGMVVQISEGTTLADTMWSCTSNATVIGTDNIVFAQMLAAAAASGSVSPTAVNAAAYFSMEEDFPLAASGTLPPPLAKDVQGSATGDYLDDAANGVYSLATAAVSEAQAAQLTFGDQLILDPSKGLIFEARVRLNIPGAAPTADERWVVGLASAHAAAEDPLDDVVSNVWFRGEGASLSIFIEGDDGTTDTDDTDSTIDYVDNTYVTLKIDMTTLAAVKFYVDGVLVGTTVSVPLLSASTLLQPIFAYQRDAGSEINLLQVDWFRVVQSRA